MYLRLGLVLALYLSGPFLIIWLYRKFKVFSKLGTIVLAYALGIVMSLSGLTGENLPGAAFLTAAQNNLQNICIPLALPLMLFSANFRLWMKSLGKTFVSFFCGIVAVGLAVSLAFLMFKNSGINELDKAAGLMMGFYTGGTPNVASLKMALQPSSETFLLVNTFEIFVTFFLLAFLVGGGYKLVRRWLVYVPENNSSKPESGEQIGSEASFEDYAGMMRPAVLKKLLLPFCCALLVVAFAAGISLCWVAADYRVISVVLVVTTLSIVFSFWKRLRLTPKMFELGMYFILVFSIIVASQFSVSRVGADTCGLLLFILSVLLLCLVFHFLLAKLCRVDADLFTISVVGLVFSPPFVPTVAGLMQSRRCLLSGIVVGLMGYAVGNYLGISLYLLLS